MKCLIMLSVPMTREHLLDIMSAYFFHIIWESSVNPKNVEAFDSVNDYVICLDC